jgi:hypothetical protein
VNDYEIKLGDAEARVERWPGGDGYMVSLVLEGQGPFSDLEEPLLRHADKAGLAGTNISFELVALYGVQEGREAEALRAAEDAIAEVNEARRQRLEGAERAQSAQEASKRAAENELKPIREAFRKLRRD